MFTKYSRALTAVGCMFFANGALNASWACRIPTLQTQLSLQPEQLGTAIFVQGIGALLGPPLVGRLSGAFGTRAVTLFFLCALCLALICIPMTNSLVSLELTLAYFGFASSIMDVTMNAQGVSIQKLGSQPVMSRLHGFWSVGATAGAMAGSLFITAGLSFYTHFLIVAAALFLLGIITRPFLLSKEDESEQFSKDEATVSELEVGKAATISPEVLWILCGICFLGFLCEAAIADWSSLYLQHSLATTAAFAPTGYAAYSASMSVGRFAGDFAIMKIGEKNTLLYGGLLTAASMAMILLCANPALAILGFTIAGLGVCAVVPIIFTLSSRVGGITAAAAIARVALAGSAGFLFGPLILGKAAQNFGYPITLVGVLLSQLAIVALSVSMGRKTRIESERQLALSKSNV